MLSCTQILVYKGPRRPILVHAQRQNSPVGFPSIMEEALLTVCAKRLAVCKQNTERSSRVRAEGEVK